MTRLSTTRGALADRIGIRRKPLYELIDYTRVRAAFLPLPVSSLRFVQQTPVDQTPVLSPPFPTILTPAITSALFVLRHRQELTVKLHRSSSSPTWCTHVDPRSPRLSLGDCVRHCSHELVPQPTGSQPTLPAPTKASSYQPLQAEETIIVMNDCGGWKGDDWMGLAQVVERTSGRDSSTSNVSPALSSMTRNESYSKGPQAARLSRTQPARGPIIRKAPISYALQARSVLPPTYQFQHIRKISVIRGSWNKALRKRATPAQLHSPPYYGPPRS
ncbi:hypothetical protein NMY22_g17481 [Coprinellus aureogranulatus]|nr:hypothetical protein NMY22_g17481 [Coprinellus aureogranulatus]